MDAIAKPRFDPLPNPSTHDGKPRRIGVEIELGDMPEREVAEVVAATFGGDIEDTGENAFKVSTDQLGTLEIYLDTSLRKKAQGRIADIGLNLSRAVVPVEIVTPPLADLSPLIQLEEALREAGASGSGEGLLYGFGVHFNPEVVSLSGAHVVPVATAYALIEDWLRSVRPIDNIRRLLPFTDPYPRGLVDALAAEDDVDLDGFSRIYLRETHGRNYGLDMLPLLMEANADLVRDLAEDLHAVSARPTYHFRLPDCRIHEPDWSLAHEWAQWVLVEHVAADTDLLDTLKTAWRDQREELVETRGEWADTVGEILGAQGERLRHG